MNLFYRSQRIQRMIQGEAAAVHPTNSKYGEKCSTIPQLLLFCCFVLQHLHSDLSFVHSFSQSVGTVHSCCLRERSRTISSNSQQSKQERVDTRVTYFYFRAIRKQCSTKEWGKNIRTRTSCQSFFVYSILICSRTFLSTTISLSLSLLVPDYI